MQCLQKTEDCVRCPGSGITDGCKVPYGCWKLNLGPAGAALLTTEPFLQSQIVIFLVFINFLDFENNINVRPFHSQISVCFHFFFFFYRHLLGEYLLLLTTHCGSPLLSDLQAQAFRHFQVWEKLCMSCKFFFIRSFNNKKQVILIFHLNQVSKK